MSINVLLLATRLALCTRSHALCSGVRPAPSGQLGALLCLLGHSPAPRKCSKWVNGSHNACQQLQTWHFLKSARHLLSFTLWWGEGEGKKNDKLLDLGDAWHKWNTFYLKCWMWCIICGDVGIRGTNRKVASSKCNPGNWSASRVWHLAKRLQFKTLHSRALWTQQRVPAGPKMSAW